jgi:capsular exopolysaccharide synthesis family protein
LILRPLIRAVRRRWPLAAAAACAALALGLLLVPGAPSRSEARARLVFRSPDDAVLPWNADRVRDLVLSDAVLAAAAKQPGIHLPPDELRARLAVGRETSAVELVSSGGGALARVNGVARAAAELLPGLRRAELDAALARTDATLKSQLSELEKLPPPARGRELEKLGAEVADLEREIVSLTLGIDQLAARLERGEPGTVPAVDTSGSDRLEEDLDSARRRLDDLRALHPEGGAPVAAAAAEADDLRLRLAQARNREILRARFAPVRRAIDELRELTARRDRLTLEISRKRSEEETARRETSGVPAADVEARRRSLAASIQDLESRRARLSAELGAGTPPVDRVEPAAGTTTLSSSFPAILLGALLVGVLAAWIAEALVTSIRTEDDVRRHVNLPVLGVIPLARGPADLALPRLNERGALAEPFDSAAALLAARVAAEKLRVVAVSSARPGEGKSTVAAQLAAALARGLQRVLLIDADLRRPSQHRTLGVPPEPGLAGYLTGAADSLETATAATETENLSAVPAGAPIPAPLPYFRSERFKSALAEVRERFDLVILDLPPVSVAAESLVAASMADGVVLVLAAGETGKDDAAAAKRLLRSAGAKLLGCVLNKAVLRSRGYYTYEPAAAAE